MFQSVAVEFNNWAKSHSMRTFMIFMGLIAFAPFEVSLALQPPLPPPLQHSVANTQVNALVPKAVPLPTSSAPIRSFNQFQVSALMESGSLQKNVRRIAAQFGWTQVVWDLPNDYEWVGTVTVTGANFNSILEKILVNYPLQATLYHGNHVLVISSRNI